MVYTIMKARMEREQKKLAVKLGRLEFKNPVILAGGCASFGEPFEGIFDISIVGALVTKGLTLAPRQGYEPPRICETPCGMLNAIGLQNPGVEVFAKAILPELRRKGVRTIVNVAGFSEEDYEMIIKHLEEEEGIYAYELDLSCPHVEKTISFSKDPLLFGSLLEKVRKLTEKPIIAKLTPATGDMVPYAKIAYGAGMDGITVSNTWPAMAIDYKTGKAKLKNLYGGLSGPAIKPLTVYRVYKCAQAVPDFPILASGGAATVEDVIEFIRAGALAVQLGTILFLDPASPPKIIQALGSIMAALDITSLDEIRGKVLPP